MKLNVYLLAYIDDLHYPSEVFNAIEVIPEDDIIDRLKTAVDEGQVCCFDDEDLPDFNTMTPEMAVDIFRHDGYVVELFEMEIKNVQKTNS